MFMVYYIQAQTIEYTLIVPQNTTFSLLFFKRVHAKQAVFLPVLN